MLRNWTMAIAVAIATCAPAITLAQPPTPPEIVHKVDRGVRRTITNLDHKIRHRRHTVRPSVHQATHRTVRTVCRDGRVHTGRSRAVACAGHGGVR